LACPFFIPTERADDISFPHPTRLPLGSSWRGRCAAPGHEQTVLDNKELEGCNLGYAQSCARLPKERACDAVRFVIAKEAGETVSVQYVLETEYLPSEHGVLNFDQRSGSWISAHPDQRIQRKAECFLQSYLGRKSH
jgi:hypothetical protein